MYMYFSCEVTIKNSSTSYVAFIVGTNNNMSLYFFENDFEDNICPHKEKNVTVAGLPYHLAASASQESNTTHYTVNSNLTIHPLFSNSENIIPPNVSCQTDYLSPTTVTGLNEPIKVTTAHRNLGG